MFEFLIYGFDNKFIFWPMVTLMVGGFIFIMRYFGLRNALFAAGVFALGLLYALSNRQSRQKGWEDRKAKERKDVEDFKNRFGDTRDQFELDLDRLRDDDGFKRKS